MGNLSTFRKLIEQGKCTHADSIGTRFSLNKKSSRVLRFQENLGTAFPQVPTPRMPSRNIPNSGYTPLWHESEKLNRLRERVSGQDNHPIHEKTP